MNGFIRLEAVSGDGREAASAVWVGHVTTRSPFQKVYMQRTITLAASALQNLGGKTRKTRPNSENFRAQPTRRFQTVSHRSADMYCNGPEQMYLYCNGTGVLPID